MTKKQLRELSIDQLTNRFELGYDYPIPTIPPVHKRDGKWTIRIITGESWRGNTRHTNWDYFHADLEGVVLNSPRGFAKEFNGKVKITGLEDWKP